MKQQPVTAKSYVQLEHCASCIDCRRIVVASLQTRPIGTGCNPDGSMDWFHVEQFTARIDPSWPSRRRIRELLGKGDVARQGFGDYHADGGEHRCKGPSPVIGATVRAV